MVTQAPTRGKVLTMVLFALSCFGLLVYLWTAFGGAIPLKPHGYRLHVNFKEATQLAVQADVRISGVTVGHVVATLPGKRATNTEIELDRRYAPLPVDSRAILRTKTLLGETYVELTPGTPGGPTVAEAASCGTARSSPRSSSTRSCARSTVRRARTSSTGSRAGRRRCMTAGRTSPT